MDNKGFTLIEALAVIVVIGIVGLIAVPSIVSTLDNSKKASNKVLYGNIKTALQTMYEEIEYSGITIYQYYNNGINTEEQININSNSITTNIQTLVSNGFLMGISNPDKDSTNKKIILNADNKDIGMCEVTIEKVKSGNKVSYKFEGSNEEDCPTDIDLEG